MKVMIRKDSNSHVSYEEGFSVILEIIPEISMKELHCINASQPGATRIGTSIEKLISDLVFNNYQVKLVRNYGVFLDNNPKVDLIYDSISGNY